jgi:regulatory protein
MDSAAFQARLAKAKNYVYRLLAYRSRSCREVRERLKKKRFSKKIIERTIKELKELNYLNDREFSSTWVDMKLSANPCGRRLIEHELRMKGIDEEIIKNVTEEAYGARGEVKIAYELALRRLRKYADLDDKKKWQRLYNLLARRGFPLELVHDVLSKVLTEDKRDG